MTNQKKNYGEIFYFESKNIVKTCPFCYSKSYKKYDFYKCNVCGKDFERPIIKNKNDYNKLLIKRKIKKLLKEIKIFSKHQKEKL